MTAIDNNNIEDKNNANETTTTANSNYSPGYVSAALGSVVYLGPCPQPGASGSRACSYRWRPESSPSPG